jgi:pyridoxine 4-dehydrogenase
VTVQNRYSIADRRHEETLKWCEGRGIGFLPWYPMAGGKLFREESPAAAAVGKLAARYEVSVAQLALAWLLGRSRVMLPIPGTAKVAHLEENVKATVIHVTDDDWRELENDT